MDNIDLFVSLSKDLNLHSEEITIVNNKIEENLFDSKKSPKEYLFAFIDVMGSTFDEGINLEKLQQFSFQPADGINYNEHKFMAVYSGGKNDHNLYNIDIKNPHDDYCVNYFLKSKKRVAKFYDLDVWKHQQPNVIAGSKILTHWGQGVSINSEKKDLYFMHYDVEMVSKFYNLPIPYYKTVKEFCFDKKIMKVFGLTYNSINFKPLKLKLYYYPNDPLMEFTVFDEI